MKFTRGYWLTRPNFNMNYATQCVRSEACGNLLRVLSACNPVRQRGDILNKATLTVSFSAPAADVIRVTVTHFAGRCGHGPHFTIHEQPVTPVIT